MAETGTSGAISSVQSPPGKGRGLCKGVRSWLTVASDALVSARGAFATRPASRGDNLRVLLVDDVLTTGATWDACARALREVGAKSVVAITVARAIRNVLPAP